MRRRRAGAAAAGVALVLALAPSGQAQESIPPAYAGSRITTPAAVSTSSPAITADIVREYNGRLQGLHPKSFLIVPGDLPSGCGPTGEVLLDTVIEPPSKPNTTSTKAIASTPCNGSYGIRVEATLRNNFGGSAVDRVVLVGRVNVVAPPSAVSGVEASADGSTVRITWSSSAGSHPDFLGYRIQRQTGDGWTTLADVGRDDTSYSDGSPPSEGRITYRVLARRSGPSGDVTCDCGGRTTIELQGSTTTSTAPGGTDGGTTGGDGGTTGGSGGADGGTTGGGADGGTPGDGTTPTTAGSSGRTPRGGRSFSALPRGQVGVGTKAPRLGTPTGANIPGLLTPDAGFDEELDYGDQELGSGDGEDGLSSFHYENAAGRGMAVPVATGFVLFAWAVHLRYLARAARPATAVAPRRGARVAGARTAGRRVTGGPARGQRSSPPTKRGWA